MTIRGRFSIFCLVEGMILLVIGFQAVQASTVNTYKIERQKSLSDDEKLHQSKYPVIINALAIAMAA